MCTPCINIPVDELPMLQFGLANKRATKIFRSIGATTKEAAKTLLKLGCVMGRMRDEEWTDKDKCA